MLSLRQMSMFCDFWPLAGDLWKRRYVLCMACCNGPSEWLHREFHWIDIVNQQSDDGYLAFNSASDQLS